MEVLLWLAPTVVVTLAAMTWAAWAGREVRPEPDPDVARARLGEALVRGRVRPYAAPTPEPDRSTGVALRRHPRP